MATTTTTPTTALFLNEDDGRITCASHGGDYLRSGHDEQPDAAWYDTPLGRWTRWTIVDENDWRTMIGTPACCESCGATI